MNDDLSESVDRGLDAVLCLKLSSIKQQYEGILYVKDHICTK